MSDVPPPATEVEREPGGELLDATVEDGTAPGDPHPDDIDWEAVTRLQDLIDKTGGDELNNLVLFHEMYGDDLELL